MMPIEVEKGTFKCQFECRRKTDVTMTHPRVVWSMQTSWRSLPGKFDPDAYSSSVKLCLLEKIASSRLPLRPHVIGPSTIIKVGKSLATSLLRRVYNLL